jgi:hypothetical protein
MMSRPVATGDGADFILNEKRTSDGQGFSFLASAFGEASRPGGGGGGVFSSRRLSV